MLITVQLHIRRPRNALGEVAAVLDPDPGVGALMHHQRGGADHRQHLAHVDRHVQPVQRLHGCRARAIPGNARPRPDLIFARGREPGTEQRFYTSWGEKRLGLLLELPPVGTLGGSELVVGRPQRAGQSPVQHQCRDPLGMGRGEHDAHRSTFRGAEQRRALRSGRVHHRPDVIASFLQRRHADIPVGQARAPLVEHDHPRMLGDTAQQRGHAGGVPVQVHVGDSPRREHHVKRALAKYLVGDRDIATTRVASFRRVHATSLDLPRRKAQQPGNTARWSRTPGS